MEGHSLRSCSGTAPARGPTQLSTGGFPDCPGFVLNKTSSLVVNLTGVALIHLLCVPSCESLAIEDDTCLV